MLRILSDSILSVIYPQECRICGEEVETSSDGVACSTCWTETKLFSTDETLCDKCGAFLFVGRSSSPALCGKCEDHVYDHAVSVGPYEKGLAATVLDLKKVPHLSGGIKRLLGDILDRSQLGNTDVVIPVPLSSRRLRERGFNQAAIIGREVANHLGVGMDEQTLIRTIHTPMHRAGMDKKARAMTVKNAFEVARPNLVAGRIVLLVDDIFTSGETASNCAKVLKKSGAATVNVLTIARAA